MVDGERSWDPAIERPAGGGAAAADDDRNCKTARVMKTTTSARGGNNHEFMTHDQSVRTNQRTYGSERKESMHGAPTDGEEPTYHMHMRLQARPHSSRIFVDLNVLLIWS
jgi:hypothetical protein